MTKKHESPVPLPLPKKKSVKVFISHSHINVSFMELICAFLKTSELVDEEIRCTSVAGHGFELGEMVQAAIRREIKASKIVIGIFTRESLASSNVMLELGAGWGFNKVLIPILGPGIQESDLPKWLQDGHRMVWTSRPCWESFEKIFKDKLDMRIKDKPLFNELIGKLVRWQPENIKL
jgi:hypothetical protein